MGGGFTKFIRSGELNNFLKKKKMKFDPKMSNKLSCASIHFNLKSTSENLNEVIEEKKRFIEEETGNQVRIETRDSNLPFGASIDFPNWNNKRELPKIILRRDVERVHFFHELIHLEKFFVDQYSIIVCNNPNLYTVLDVFKNIPEDYVAHEIINKEYGFDPINVNWFRGKDDLGLPVEEIAANLIKFYCHYQFHPEYEKELISFHKSCRKQKPEAFLIADRSIKALNRMNYKQKESYNECAEEIIKIFAQTYFNRGQIYLSYLSEENNEWRWNP